MSSQLLPVQSGYDRWATVYDHDANPLPALDTPIVRAAIHAVAPDLYGQQVLDLGCGTGRHTIWLAEQGAQVTGLDFSEGMLAQARRKPGAAGVRFVRHDLHQPLPRENEEFDLVVSSLVLEHLADLKQFFGEARRVLRPGGHAVVSAMHPAMFLRGSQARFTDPASGELVQPGSLAHSLSAFVMAAVRAGFQLSDLEEISPDRDFASHYPRAEKYVGWPMQVVMTLRAGAAQPRLSGRT